MRPVKQPYKKHAEQIPKVEITYVNILIADISNWLQRKSKASLLYSSKRFNSVVTKWKNDKTISEQDLKFLEHTCETWMNQ